MTRDETIATVSGLHGDLRAIGVDDSIAQERELLPIVRDFLHAMVRVVDQFDELGGDITDPSVAKSIEETMLLARVVLLAHQLVFQTRYCRQPRGQRTADALMVDCKTLTDWLLGDPKPHPNVARLGMRVLKYGGVCMTLGARIKTEGSNI